MSITAMSAAGFGRRDASDEIEQAIAIAKIVQKPVKLVWTREEDTRRGQVPPACRCRLQGRRRPGRNADSMVDACRDVLDLGKRRPKTAGQRPGAAIRGRPG